VLTVKTPIGRIVRRKFRSRGLPLARVRPKDFTAAGIERVPRTAGARGGLPVLDDGRDLDVTNVIWCTGFVPDFTWIDLPVFAEDGDPVHDRGIVGSEPGLYFAGLYFVGLVFLHALASSGSGGTRSTSPRTSHRPDGTVSPPGRSERDALMLGPTWTDGATDRGRRYRWAGARANARADRRRGRSGRARTRVAARRYRHVSARQRPRALRAFGLEAQVA
jgi:hypothetical protein